MNNSQQDPKRIVISGVGVISKIGLVKQQFWRVLSGQESIEDEVPFTGHVREFGELPDSKRKAIRKALKLMNRETQMGVAAGQLALGDSGALSAYAADRFGVCFGADNVSIMPEDFSRGIQACSDSSGEFDAERWGEDGIDSVAPLWILKCLPNMPACHLAIINDLQGPSNTITQRDVSANMAIAEACRMIRGGDADAVVTGATGTTLTTFNLMHARLEGEVTQDSSGLEVSRPFDQRRSGAAPGEGAGAIVLEELQSALARGATIYGEILGAASSSAIGTDRVTACRTALTRAMRATLRQSEQEVGSIGHLHAHGLGSRDSDIAEAQAIQEVFGEMAPRVPVVAAKSQLANCAAGAGMLELIASLLALEDGCLFPVQNLNQRDPECPVHAVTGHDEPAGESFLNLNMFSRGLASCVAVGKYQSGRTRKFVA